MKKFLLLFLVPFLPLTLSAQICDTSLWAPDGPVKSLFLRDSILYVGGDFKLVSPVIGHLAVVDSSTAALVHPFPMIRGTVNCIAKDSLGRIYVGGDFYEVGNTAVYNLFRLDTNGNFDPGFQPLPNGKVTALYVAGDYLYVGGDFTSIAGFTRTRGARFRVTHTVFSTSDSMFHYYPAPDSLNDFDPRADAPIYAYCINPINGNLLVGGDFAAIGGSWINYLAYLYPATGDYVSHGNVPWSLIVNGRVKSIAVRAGKAYVAGEFTAFGTNQRKGLAVVDIGQASVVSYDAQLNGFADDVKIVGDRVYVGGSFTNSNSTFRDHIACFTPALTLRPWAPAAGAEVTCIQPWDGLLCIGGDFINVGATTCYHAALLDTASGTAAAWDPQFNGNVRSIMPGKAGKIYCGGDFFGAGGVGRNNICAININTKRPTAWAPFVNGTVNTIAGGDTLLYIAGTFSSIDAVNREGIAAFGLSSGSLDAFDPGVDGLVRTIVEADSLVYIGGNFSTAANQPRENMACINISSSAATSWNPGCQGTVNKIILDHNQVYVGGFYSHLGNLAHDNLGRVDRITGLADGTWNCNTSDGIYDIDLYNGKLFMGGWFLNVNGYARQYFAACDTVDGTLYSENPGFNDYIHSFARYTTDLFIAGPFANVGISNYYPAVCDYDNSAGAFDAWSPAPDAFPQALAVNQSWLFMGGSFLYAGHFFHPDLAMVNVNSVTGTSNVAARTGSIRLYPDPAAGTCFVDLENIPGKISTVEIRDVAGRLLRYTEVNAVSGNATLSIDLAGLTEGIYMITLRTGEGNSYCGKVVKQ